MSQSMNQAVSSRCGKCNGYVDHVSMICIMCNTESPLQPTASLLKPVEPVKNDDLTRFKADK